MPPLLQTHTISRYNDFSPRLFENPGALKGRTDPSQMQINAAGLVLSFSTSTAGYTYSLEPVSDVVTLITQMQVIIIGLVFAVFAQALQLYATHFDNGAAAHAQEETNDDAKFKTAPVPVMSGFFAMKKKQQLVALQSLPPSIEMAIPSARSQVQTPRPPHAHVARTDSDVGTSPSTCHHDRQSATWRYLPC